MTRLMPNLAVGLAVALFCYGMARPVADPSGELNLNDFARLPVVDRGRVKPIDTVARTALMVISGGRQTLTDDSGKVQPAVRWLLDVISHEVGPRSPAADHKVFRIENDQVLNLLGLNPRPGSYRYALSEFAPKWEALHESSQQAAKVESAKRTLFQAKVLELRQHVEIYLELSQHTAPLMVPPQSDEETWRPLDKIDQSAMAVVKARLGSDFDPKSMSQQELLRLLTTELGKARREVSPAGHALRSILDAYRAGRAAEFNQNLLRYRAAYLDHIPASDLARVEFEVFYNRFLPFYQCMPLYVAAAVMVLAYWMTGARPLKSTAITLLLLTFALHTFAILARMYIQNRPPITNLYSTAIFIGWSGVLMGLVIERLYPRGLGTLLAAVLGFGGCLIAHFLGTSGDTLEMMQAVLDTNFWLATHVVIINFGYGATFVAAAVGATMILGGLSRTLPDDAVKPLADVTYGTVCFATLLSLVGTVLGGIWADQSWGRFWGWDPKENGALLIVLWNALILHARWGGMIKHRGLAVLAVWGGIVTVWSWFGTNQLGVGLHAYGFSDGMARGIVWSSLAFLAIGALGLIPVRRK